MKKETNGNIGQRIMFLGDSITADGRYLAYTEAYLWRTKPDRRFSLINLGVSSETASGLSEPDHPWPRPCIAGRAERALEKADPDVAVLCYGMNDGIYHPFSEQRFAAFREGILDLVSLIQRYGAKAVVMTPPPFDVRSIGGTPLSTESGDFNFTTPYEGYNQVLKRYADWLLSLANKADQVIDLHTPLQSYIDRQRLHDPDFRWGDGIHPETEGHRIMAQVLLTELFGVTAVEWPDYLLGPGVSGIYDLMLERHILLSDAWREHVGHDNPDKAEAMPLEKALREGASRERRLRSLTAD